MSASRIAYTVAAPTIAEQRRVRDEVSPSVDLVELRLDALPSIDVRALLADRVRPVIVTCRPAWEGGGFTGGEDDRCRILTEALEAGAEYVDVEWRASFVDAICRRAPHRVVVSSHDFAGVPADLDSRVRAMRALGARTIKVAVTATALSDMVRLGGVDDGGTGERVLIAMGTRGVASRVLAARFGSAWTYAGGASIAPGQPTLGDLLETYRFRHIGASTPVYAVVGRPIAHSLSPTLHNAAFGAAGVDAVYVPLEAADWADFERAAAFFDLQGCSVTAPFKRDAMRAATIVDAGVRETGAANTLKRVGQTWHARNTDIEGFLAPLAVPEVAGRRVHVLGAGGAARAVVCAMKERGAQVTLHARNPDAARAVASALGVAAAPTFAPEPGSWDVLVNSTPVGTAPHLAESPLEASALGEALAGKVVYDLVYNPAETRLLRDAALRGATVISGRSMLVAQAEAQFAWWTGRPAPTDVMRDVLDRRLRGSA